MAFHSYPHVIRRLFNAYRFGPPGGFTPPSACARVDHTVSRPPRLTKSPSSDSLSLRLRASSRLASPDTATRRLIMQKARRHGTKPLRPLAGTWFQGLFHSPPGVLPTFPSRYLSTIGLSLVFSLSGWSPTIRPGFLVPRVTQVPAWPHGAFRVRGYHPLRRDFPDASATLRSGRGAGPITPCGPRPARFGLLRVRSPLLAESLLFSFPAGT